MIAGNPSLTKPSAPKEAIVRMVFKATVVNLEIKKPAGKWEKPPECIAPPLRLLVERPGDLWMQAGLMNTDRATVEHVAAQPPAQSLYLIRPERFRLHLATGS